MATGSLTVVQCWDDGVTADVRLTDILRRHDAKATFNLNAGLHEARRTPGWTTKAPKSRGSAGTRCVRCTPDSRSPTTA